MEYTIEPQLDGYPSSRDLESCNIKCVQSSGDYSNDFVCFNFALNDYNILSCEEALNELECNYNQVNIGQAKEGDIISYHTDSGMICRNRKPTYRVNHFAVITKTDKTIQGTTIQSKWGTDGVFEGSIDNIPDYYGEVIAIWRKNN